MKSETTAEIIKKKVALKLPDYTNNLSDDHTEAKKLTVEQYKLLVDSSHKIDDRRNGSNTIFIAINSIFITVLMQIIPYPDAKFEKLIILSILLPVGMMVSWNWLRIIGSYKNLNYINYLLVKALEKSMPASIFDLRSDIMAEIENPRFKANVILRKETLLPMIFINLYLVYFLFVFALIVRRHL